MMRAILNEGLRLDRTLSAARPGAIPEGVMFKAEKKEAPAG